MSAEILTNTTELRELRVRARRTADFLKLPLRNKVWSGGTGDFMGRSTGSSLDFQDHRAYTPGDDPRHINWQAYARTGQYSMKLFREEVRPVVDLIFECSPSAFFDPAKARRSLELFYFCAEGALKSGASLHIYLLNGQKHTLLGNDIYQTEKWPSRIPIVEPAYPPVAPGLNQIPLRANSLRLFVSDVLWPGDPEPIAQALATRNGRGAILAPYADAEAQVAWDGNYEFVEAETQARHQRRVEPGLLKRYQQAYSRHFEVWANACQRYGVAFTRVSAAADFQKALQTEALRAGVVEM
jgi:uncharacterized protein (DUF58 family)